MKRSREAVPPSRRSTRLAQQGRPIQVLDAKQREHLPYTISSSAIQEQSNPHASRTHPTMITHPCRPICHEPDRSITAGAKAESSPTQDAEPCPHMVACTASAEPACSNDDTHITFQAVASPQAPPDQCVAAESSELAPELCPKGKQKDSSTKRVPQLPCLFWATSINDMRQCDPLFPPRGTSVGMSKSGAVTALLLAREDVRIMSSQAGNILATM
uniref:Uncharacterized protein n=1 Tax=Melanopsichium pennsylvanicum 4 TaxID=1398559 RepID=A0A077R8L2_9BASI|nr:uncharacterized protein BN887_05261 [Melanopsichium pennsylvanicum 4]